VNPEDALSNVCEAWNRLDPGALAELFTDDGRYEDPLKESTLVGRQQIFDGNAPAMEMLSDCEVTLSTVISGQESAFAEGFFRSSLATGGRMDFPFALLVEMEGGKIKRCAEFFDTRPLIA
jgi:ketosteroid isomerase-like protein